MIRHETTAAVIAAAIDVHRGLGPGLLESAYDECLAVELAGRRRPPRPAASRGGRARRAPV